MSDSDDEDYNPAEVLAVPPQQQRVPDQPDAGAPSTNAAVETPGATSDSAPHPSHPGGASLSEQQPKSTPSAGPVDETPIDAGGLRLHSIKGRVRCLCVNPAGTLVCAGGEDGQLAMWDFTVDLPTRRVHPTRVLTPFVNRVSGLQPIIALHLATDGSYLVACQDGDCPALVAHGGKQLGYCAMGERGLLDVVKCKGHRAPVTASSPHAGAAGQFFTCGQDGTARLWAEATFERHSVYAVKHGSGGITDTVVVESVLSLSHFSGSGAGSVFATAGDDGCVQLWDSRAKYRPGGVLAAWDVYGLPMTRAGRRGEDYFEKHTGGMAELAAPTGNGGSSGDGGGDPSSTSSPVLAVRRGGVVQFLDLRRLPKVRTVGRDAACLACNAATDLPFVTDTTPLTTADGGRTLLTCTARAGFNRAAGGHVVSYAAMAAVATITTPSSLSWRPAAEDEDVLCAVADGEGRLYAGLSSGDVVVQRGSTTAAPLGVSPAVDHWLDSRPRRDYPGSDGRLGGEKAPRPDDVGIEDLF